LMWRVIGHHPAPVLFRAADDFSPPFEVDARCVHIPELVAEQRRALWQTALDRCGLAVGGDELNKLARFELSVGLIDATIRDWLGADVLEPAAAEEAVAALEKSAFRMVRRVLQAA
ncbi:MAG: hypothetical protein AAGC55_25080, partial [Myxococcota bacterium]